MQLLDRFEGIPAGSDPFCCSFKQNRYSRQWVHVYVWDTDKGKIGSHEAPKFMRAIAYIRNKSTWEGMPSQAYLTACYKNISPFWPTVDRYGKLMILDEHHNFHGEFHGNSCVNQVPHFTTRSFLSRLPKYEPTKSTYAHDNSSDAGTELTKVNGAVADQSEYPIYCTMCVYDLDSFSPNEGTFRIVYRMYLWWEFKNANLVHFLDRARTCGGELILTQTECEDVKSEIEFPKVNIYNKVEEPVEMDPPTVRIFAPSLVNHDGPSGKDMPCDCIPRGWIMWNAQYTCRVKGKFDLHDFPFDSQQLSLELKILQERHASAFSLIMGSVQFHKRALDMIEWRLGEPATTRKNDDASSVAMFLSRRPGYYIFNVCCLLGALSMISTLAFTCDLDANGDRLGVNMTLLLAAVAFKQLTAESLPKVSYTTIIDKWMLLSIFVLFASTVACVLPSAFIDDRHYALSVNKYCAILVVILTAVIAPGYLVWSGLRVSVKSPIIKRHTDSSKLWHTYDFCTNMWFLNESEKERCCL